MIYPNPSQEYILLEQHSKQCKRTVVIDGKFLACRKCIQFHKLKAEIDKWKKP